MGADATVSALSEYYVRRYNLANRDAEYAKNRWTLGRLKRNGERLKSSDVFHETVRVADAWSDSPDFAVGMANFVNDRTFRWAVGSNLYPQYGRATRSRANCSTGRVPRRSSIAREAAIGGIANNMLDSVEFQLWNTVAARGRIASGGLNDTAAARILTMETEDQVYNFPVNMRFSGSTTSTSAGTDRADLYAVTSIDPPWIRQCLPHRWPGSLTPPSAASCVTLAAVA